MLHRELRCEDPQSFMNYIRMNEAMLEELLMRITPLIQKKDTVMREAIAPRERLVATLRFLATGNSYKDLSYSVRIAPNTLARLIPETLRAIIAMLEDEFMACPSNPIEWQAIAEGFYMQWQFPHCIGSMDGKHINFRPHREDGSLFRNYKGRDSIILLALVDACYRFLYINVGHNGRMHDASVFRESPLSERLYSGALKLPLPCPLPGSDQNVPYVIVADDAFPLKENIMKPYPERNMTRDKRIYNYRLSRARRVVENAFGILANRFRILLNVIPLSANKVELITYACCLLHNFILKQNIQGCFPLEFHHEDEDCDQSLSSLRSITRQGGNRPTENAMEIRDKFRNYFITVGTVPWQEDAIKKGNF
ncbi:putative nuclease HARBI1 [Formica fusca]